MNQDDYEVEFTTSNAPETLCIQNTPHFPLKHGVRYAVQVFAGIGGGGGTSWRRRLGYGYAGVLFYHETPMRDSFGKIEAWKHYIPVNEDLTSLMCN